MAEKEVFNPPRSIEIDKYIYSFKSTLTNNFFSYRCKHRIKCKITIKIEKSELIKYLENKNNRIKYNFTNNNNIKQKTKGKRNYNEAIGEKNELKLF